MAEMESGASEPPRGGLLQRHGTKLLLSILLGVGLTWLLSKGGLPLLPPASSFSQVRWWVVPLYVLSLVVVHYFRAIRWRHLLRPLGEVSNRSIVAVSWISFGVILLSPLRSGEVVRPYLITKRSAVRMWEATATVGAERVIDGMMLSLLLFASMQLSTPLSPLPDHVGDLSVPVAAVPGAAYTALLIFFTAFVVMGVFFWRRELARRMTHRVLDVVSSRLANYLSAAVERIADGLRFLPSGKLMLPFVGESMIYWSSNALGLWLLAWGTGLAGATVAQCFVVMGVIGIGILVPAGPGYFGAFQLSTYMALAMYFPEPVLKGPGAAFVFLVYACQIGWHLVATLIGLLLDPEAKPALEKVAE
jgi:glycosyltransferase 2 family protein